MHSSWNISKLKSVGGGGYQSTNVQVYCVFFSVMEENKWKERKPSERDERHADPHAKLHSKTLSKQAMVNNNVGGSVTCLAHRCVCVFFLVPPSFVIALLLALRFLIGCHLLIIVVTSSSSSNLLPPCWFKGPPANFRRRLVCAWLVCFVSVYTFVYWNEVCLYLIICCAGF